MLDVRFICENPELVRKNCAAKGEKRADIDAILEVQAEKKKVLREVEKARTKINTLSKEIGAAKKADPKANIESQQKESRAIGDSIKASETTLKELGAK